MKYQLHNIRVCELCIFKTNLSLGRIFCSPRKCESFLPTDWGNHWSASFVLKFWNMHCSSEKVWDPIWRAPSHYPDILEFSRWIFCLCSCASFLSKSRRMSGKKKCANCLYCVKSLAWNKNPLIALPRFCSQSFPFFPSSHFTFKPYSDQNFMWKKAEEC